MNRHKKNLCYVVALIMGAVFFQRCGSSEDDPKKIETLTITGISPDTGTAGTAVLIRGAGFGTTVADVQVTLQGKICDVADVSDAQLSITIPTGGASGKLKVTVKSISAESPTFTYTTIPVTPTECPLDNTFDTDGKVYTDFNGYVAIGCAVALQKDSKIVSAGVSGIGGLNKFIVMRHLPDGSPDTQFGTNGVVTPSLGSGYEICYSMMLDVEDKILVGGTSNGSYAVARLKSNGELDETFSGDGKTSLSFGPEKGSWLRKLLLQPDGKILALGEAWGDASTEFSAARFNANGTLDESFGTDGKAMVKLSDLNDFGQDAVLQSDGKIIIVGSSTNQTTGIEVTALIRLNGDGTLDTGFGTGGKVISIIGGTSTAQAVTLDATGKLLVTGTSDGSMFLAQYNSNGTPSSSFASSGVAIVNFDDFGRSKSYAVALDKNGKIIIGGHGWAPGMGGLRHAALVRFNSNGSLDTTFDGDGKMLNVMYDYFSEVADLLIQEDDKILVAGTSSKNQGEGNPILYRVENCQ